ncbi:MAG: fibronectin type III domain-containing protein [Bacteroidales bacterium]|nr:fibronectin type III domain-containing protein [Bacteroidales bacterium]
MPERNLFNFAFENDFEDNQLGPYLDADWRKDWNWSSVSCIPEPAVLDIVNENDSYYRKFFRGYLEEGKYQPANHGWYWNSRLPSTYKELYFSYDIRFKPGFEWVLGGKIPGISGGKIVSGSKPGVTDGFTVRMMWKDGGKLVFYVYHQDQPLDYGSTYFWGDFTFTSGKWYNITIRVVVNTINNDIASNNGILEGFIDGKLMFQKTDFKFRSLESIEIDNMIISAFFGGNDDSWAAARDEWIDTDNYVAFVYGSSILNVPRGNEKSSPSKVLLHPYRTISDTDWKKSLKYSSATTSSVILSWDDYPVPAAYTLERQEQGSTTFTTVASVTYGNKSFTDTNLKSGTPYNYRLKAGNSTSNQITISTLHPVLPNAPDDLSSTGQTKSSISLKWTDNATNELGFKIFRSESAAEGFSEIATVKSDVIIYTDSLLQPSTTYYYRICAYNTNGNSDNSAVLTVSTQALQIPDAPANLTASGQTKTSVTLKWTDNANNEQGFIIYRSLSSSGNFTEIANVAAGIVTYTDTLLLHSTAYYYKICAYNIDGNSSFTQVLEASTLALQPPSAPSALTATGETKSTVNLAWTDNSDNEQGFILYRSLSAEDQFTEIAIIDDNITSFTDDSLQPSTAYYYSLKAYNQDGHSSYTPIISTKTADLQIPLPPSNLIASHFDYSSVTLLWSDNSVYETWFELERTGPDSEIKNFITVPGNTVTYTDTGLIMNSHFKYRLRAGNDDGVSEWSTYIDIYTPRLFPPAAPTKLKNTKVTDNSVSVSWSDNSSNEDAFVITRSLTTEPVSAVFITVNANNTTYTDTCLTSSTTYQYTIKAINKGGSSSLSNKNVATTLSQAELKRCMEGLVAYYNFGYNPDYIIYDQSGYGDPVNLSILNRSAIKWNHNNKIDLLSNTAMVSITPATKIIKALKKTNELTFECWLKPLDPDFTIGSRIASLGNSDDDVGFLLDQDFSGEPLNESLSYSIRMQTASTNASGYPVYIFNGKQPYISLFHLVYTRDSKGNETMYLNGTKSADGFRPNDIDTWKDDYYLRLGNESDMNHSWKGSYYSVAVYNKALTIDEVMKNYTAGPCDSLQNNDISYNLELFPNPVNNLTTLRITPEHFSDYVPQTTLRLLNTYGEVLHEESLFNPGNQLIKTLDCSHYQSGIYFIQIISGKHQQTMKMIVLK